MLSLRYLRARRKEGFISVIAGLLLPRHHARRRDADHRDGGDERLPQGAARQDPRPQRPPAGAAAGDRRSPTGSEVAERIAKVAGITLAAPIVEGQALASSPFNACRRPGARHARGAISSSCRRSPTTSGRARSTASTRGRGVAIGRRLADQLSLRVGDNITLVAPRGAVTPMGTTPRIKTYKVAAVFEIGMSEYDAAFVFMPLAEAQAYFNRSRRRDRDRGLHRRPGPASTAIASS